MHRIVATQNTLGILNGPLEEGQKLVVIGRLRGEQYMREDGKNGQTLFVSARQIYLCDTGYDDSTSISNENESDSNTDSQLPNEFLLKNLAPLRVEIQDQNHVELFDQICFDVKNEQKFSQFSLAYHYVEKYSIYKH